MLKVFRNILDVLLRSVYIIILINLELLFSARGDLISAEILSTRNLLNTQSYIESELNQIVSDMFSIEPAKYG